MTNDARRDPVVSGRFYPHDPDILEQVVTNFLSVESDVECSASHSIMLMLPHAGYVFSGVVAGATINAAHVSHKYILLGPSHTGQGLPLAVWPTGEWLTPLGAVTVDATLAQDVLKLGVGFEADTKAHLQEHSLEVLLPFFQQKFKNEASSMLPICVGTYDFKVLEEAGQALGKLLLKRQVETKEKITIIVSSDMSHYISYAEAHRLDSLALEQIKELNPKGLFEVVMQNKISMCGMAPAVMGLFAALELGAKESVKVAYTSSGQTGQAFGATLDKVVGYAGLIIS